MPGNQGLPCGVRRACFGLNCTLKWGGVGGRVVERLHMLSNMELLGVPRACVHQGNRESPEGSLPGTLPRVLAQYVGPKAEGQVGGA